MTDHKAQSGLYVFAGSLPLWSLQQGGRTSISPDTLFIFHLVWRWIGGYSFGAWQQLCDYMFMRVNFFVKIRKQVFLYELVSRYWTTVPSFFPPFNPCTHPTRGHCYYPCFIHGAQRELWMIRYNCRNKSWALDTRVLSVLFSCSVGANCTAQQCLGSDWAISETWLGLPSPPVPPVMWEGSAGMCPFRSPQSID